MAFPGTLGWATALVFWAAQTSAQQPGDRIEGVISQVELSPPRAIRVKTTLGEVRAGVTERTLVVFEGRAAAFAGTPDLSSLKSGMTVRFAFDPEFVPRIFVVAVPKSLRAEASERVPAAPARIVKARIRDLRYDARRRRGEVKADVAGRRETYRTSDPLLFRGFRRGDLVLLGLADDGTLVAIHSARLNGRVIRIDARRRTVTVVISGTEEEFTIEKDSLLDRVRAGDVIRFDVEEQSGGRRVITAVY